jgi:hypothetical protein
MQNLSPPSLPSVVLGEHLVFAGAHSDAEQNPTSAHLDGPRHTRSFAVRPPRRGFRTLRFLWEEVRLKSLWRIRRGCLGSPPANARLWGGNRRIVWT